MGKLIIMNPEIILAEDGAQLVEMLAARLVMTARKAIDERGAFSLALSGGSTPKALYQKLASSAWKDQIEWEKCDIVFGDDRAVAPDDALSNYRMARETLLDAVPARVHRIETEREDLEQVATDYETVLRGLGGRLDVVLLGLGDDGHTASLFPHSPQLDAKDRWVTATPVASLEPHVRRVTLTFDAINASRHAWFLAVGAGKAERVYDVLRGSKNVAKWPAQGVNLAGGELVWFLDEAAARELD